MRPTKLLNLLASNAKRGEFRAEGNTIYLYDVIVGSELEAEFWGGVSPEAFTRQLGAMTGAVTLRINSPGGEVFAATAMAQAMREYPSDIDVIVDGVCASAATILAVTGTSVTMAPGTLLMIHEAQSGASGRADDLRAWAAVMDKVNLVIADAYAAKTGKEAAAFAQMMAAETWFSPAEALAAGLADAVIAAGPKPKAMWDLSIFEHAPAMDAVAEPTPQLAAAPDAVTELDEPVSSEADQAAAAAVENERADRIAASAKSARIARADATLQPAD